MKYQPKLQFEDKYNIRNKTISEIRNLINEVEIDRDLIDALYADNRKTTSKIAVQCEKMYRKDKALKEKLSVYKNIENQLYNKGFESIYGFYVTGIPAAAGPLTFCMIKLNRFIEIKGIKYSNELTTQQRQQFYEKIKSKADVLRIEHLSSKVIDKIGIKKSIQKGYRQLKSKIDYDNEVDLDKLYYLYYKYGLDEDNSKLIKDTSKKVYLLACASIATKVNREKKMIELSKKYPAYHFKDNYGYITEKHRKAVKKQGFSPFHRKSFDFEKKLEFEF
jgi:ribonuclease HII